MKDFLSLKPGDEIMYTKISDSKIVIGPKGTIFKIKIRNIVKTWDSRAASICFDFDETLDGHMSFFISEGETTHVLYENRGNKPNLNLCVLGLSKEELLKKTLVIIDSNINDLNIAKDVIKGEYDDVINEVTLEEAASIAL